MSHSVSNFSGDPLRNDKNLANRQFLEFGDFMVFVGAAFWLMTTLSPDAVPVRPHSFELDTILVDPLVG